MQTSNRRLIFYCLLVPNLRLSLIIFYHLQHNRGAADPREKHAFNNQQYKSLCHEF